MVLAACVTAGEATTGTPPPERQASPDSAGVLPEPDTGPELTPGAEIPSTALAARPLHEGRVLVSVAAKLEWAAMPITSVEQIDYHETWTFEAGVNVADLPHELRASLGEAFDLYGVAGKLCTVRLDQLAIEAYVLPDDNEESLDIERLWQLVERPGEYDRVLLLLVAGFATNPRCDGALWAREARLPPPSVLVPADIDDEAAAWLAEERARVLGSEAGRELTKQYRAYAEDEPSAMPWSTYSEGRSQIWTDDQADPRLVVVAFGEGMSVPCFTVPGYAAARPIDEEGPWPYPLWGRPTPSAVFDADLDGRYEMLFLRAWGGLVHLELISETLHLELTVPEDSSYNC